MKNSQRSSRLSVSRLHKRMVSIVITAYNVEKWIKETVRSACRQRYNDIEIIVVEDCSTDNTRKELAILSDNRIKILYNDRNIGAGASRRRGIEASSGEYILLLDGDDLIKEDFVEELYGKAIEQDADIVSGGITIEHDDGSRETSSYGNVSVEGDDKICRFWGEKVVFMNNKLIRRSLHEKVPYSTRRFIEDTPVIIPMLYLANKVVYTDNCGYIYRMNSESLTHKASPFKYALFRALCADDIITFFEEHDRGFIERLPFATAYSRCLYEIRRCHPTKEMIEPYKDEWIEFTARLMQRLCPQQ
ncbi:MAG: glycosyltransferase family 2 protein [Bacteroidaceae bacterium]|nr:glycosyltransferase family 2 protein [Bacteroidaceae bacterium]